MTRPTGILVYYVKIETTPKYVRCKFCNKSLYKNATRLSKHFLDGKCQKSPPSVKQKVARMVNERNMKLVTKTNARTNSPEKVLPSNTSASMRIHCGDDSPVTKAPVSNIDIERDEYDGRKSTAKSTWTAGTPGSSGLSRSSSKSMESVRAYMDVMSPEEQEKLNILMGRAMYVTACPLGLFDSPVWQNFFVALRPAFHVPKRKQLSTTLLDREYEENKTYVNVHIIDAQHLALQLDGWSNSRRDGIINIILCTPKPVFWKSIPTEENRHTAIYYSKLMIETIREFDPEKFFVICTDNAAVMIKACELVIDEFPNIDFIGCIAHSFHLIIKYLLQIKTISEFMQNLMNIGNTVRDSHVLLATFNNERKKSNASQSTESLPPLKVHIETRWGTVKECAQSVQKNRTILRHMAVNDDLGMNPKVKNVILSDEFWSRLDLFLRLINPIVTRIKCIEADDSTIDMVYTYTKTIREHIYDPAYSQLFTKTERNTFKSKVEERLEFCLRRIHLSAHLISPEFRGNGLEDTELESAMHFLDSLAKRIEDVSSTKVMVQLAQFKNKEGLWRNDFVWKCIESHELSPYLWWKTYGFNTDLSKVALMILSMPTTSAATERSFSVQGNIHSKKRNKLTNKRTEKLTFIKYNHRLKNKGSVCNTDAKRKLIFDEFEEEYQENDFLMGQKESEVEKEEYNSDSETEDEDDYSLHDSTEPETFSDIEVDLDLED